MLHLQQGHLASRQALWVNGKPFVEKQKEADKGISHPPQEGQTQAGMVATSTWLSVKEAREPSHNGVCCQPHTENVV